jgi:hypothetical protein
LNRNMEIIPEHEEIHSILLNWARWCKTGNHPQRCKSLEGNYRPPPMYHEPVPSNPPDVLQAIKVEILISRAPSQYGKHLICWYIKRLPPQAIKKKLSKKADEVDHHLYMARAWLKRVLTSKQISVQSPLSTGDAAYGCPRQASASMQDG